MPVDQMQLKNLLDELSSSGGGSLVKKVVKSEISSGGKVLLIGLGGMGCQTINTTKGVYLKNFNDTGRIEFLAVDTDQEDMADLNVQNEGNLTLSETFAIYDAAAHDLLINKPPSVESWLSEDVPAEPILGDGAKQRRAVGRVMLCATQKYEALRDQIKSKIEALAVGATDILQVVIIAGISGGTGSGTFIDVSYMVRMLLDQLKIDTGINSKMFGVFYTPDVQKSVPDIGGNPDRWANLQRNGYAAFKDLDYFMNVGNETVTENVYSIRTLGGTYTSHKRLFERGNVYIVSPTNSCNRCEDIIATTAESLMDLFREGQTDGGVMTQSLLSELSNATALGNTWDNNNVGKQADNAIPADNSAIKNTLLPAFMNYNFSSFGVRSIYFPRNEMVAYCANQAFLAVYSQWSRAFNYTQETVNAAAVSCGIGSPDDIYSFMYRQFGITEDTFRIQKGETNYPVRRGFAVAGRVEGTADTITESTERVNRKLNEISQQMCDQHIEAFVNTIKSRFENQEFLFNEGPFAAITLLSGSEGRLSGFIQILDNYINNIAITKNQKKQEMERAINQLRAGQQTLDADKNPHDNEIEAFVELCKNYAKAFFEYSFFDRFMQYIISKVRQKLNDFNTETFDIYVPILDCVMNMLSEDATAFAEGTLSVEGNRSVYSLNAFALNDARRQNNLFSNLFEGYIDQQKVNQVKAEFVASLFDPNRKSKWQDIATNPTVLADEIRIIFNAVTSGLVSQMLEKLIIMVYGDRTAIVNANEGNVAVTIDAVNAVWNDTVLRGNALRSAAQNIVEALTDSLMLKFEVGNETSNEFSKKAVVILLNETPNLNAAIRQELVNKFGENGCTVATMGDGTTCAHKTNITMAMSRTFIPLAMISNMQGYAKEYFKSEGSAAGQAGRHLDEVTEKWQDNLPEIFGMDTEAYFVERGRIDLAIPDEYRAVTNEGIKNQDKKMYGIIRDAVDYGIEKGYIYADNNKFYLIKLTDTSPEFLERIEEVLLQMKVNNPEAKWTDAIALIEGELHVSKTQKIQLDSDVANDILKAKQTVMPDNDFDIKNIYRLIRSDMRKIKLVVETKQFYEKTDFFYNMDNLADLRSNVALFIKAIKVGAISYDEQSGWYCKYSDSQYEPAIKFFDDYMRKNEQLDVPFKWYLVFSAFVKNALCNDSVTEGINAKFEQMQRDRLEYEDWSHIIAEMTEAMNGEIMHIRDPRVREAQLEPYYINSNYKELYSYPKKYKGAQTLIYNFNKFIDELNYCRQYANL